MNKDERERVIALAVRMVIALRTLQRLAGLTDKEMLVALAHGARFEDMEADYQRYVDVYGPLEPPSTAAEWEKLARRLQELQ